MLKSEVQQHLASQKLKYIASNVTFVTLLCNHTWIINRSSAALNRLPFVSTWKYTKCAWADGAQISAIERSMDDIGKPPSQSHALLTLLSPPGSPYLFTLLSPCVWLCLTNQHVWLDQDAMKPDNTHPNTGSALHQLPLPCLKAYSTILGSAWCDNKCGQGSHSPFYCSVVCTLVELPFCFCF